MDERLQARLEEDSQLCKAAEWFLELRSDSVSGERVAEWQLWLAEDSAHREAFERVEAFWRLSDNVAAHWPAEAEVAADRYSGEESIAAWRARQERKVGPLREPRAGSERRWRRYVTACGAGLALAAGIALVMLLYWPAVMVTLEGGERFTVETGIGETRTLTLPDGTVISAGGETLLVATLLEHSRSVVLTRGEAYFHVVRDLARPFAVHAGNTTITDVGTAFDVRRTLGGVVVAVAEGVVRVAESASAGRSRAEVHSPDATDTLSPGAVQLTAGERLTLAPFDAAPRLTSVSPKWVAGWREGRLQYVDEPLAGVVADLVRYSTRKIEVGDPAVGKLRVTGVVFLQNVDGWLASLQASFPVRVVTGADGSVTILQR